MVQEEFRELLALKVAVAIAVELKKPTGQLFGGNHLALADAAAEFDGKIQASHAMLGVHYDQRVRPVARRVYTSGVVQPRRRRNPIGFTLLLTILLPTAVGTAGCASSPVADPQPVFGADVPWPSWATRARELLQRLVAVDTSHPRGARRTAPDLLQAFLRRESVESQLLDVGRGRTAVWGRVEAVDAQGPPIVLLSHLDTPSLEATDWPANTPPLAVTTRDGRLWGSGIAGGKGLAVLHATSLAILASQGGPQQRDVHMVALPDAFDRDSRSLDQVIAAIPALATATVALAGGGADIADWIGDGRTIMAVSVGERGTAWLQIAAVTRSDGIGPSSSERLAAALVAIQAAPGDPRLTRTSRALLKAAAVGRSAARRWLSGSSLGAQLFVVPELMARPGMASQFVDELTTLRLDGGRPGSTESPRRSRALVRARLLEDMSPGELVRRLRTAIDDPDVHITVRGATPLSLSGVKEDWLGRIRRAADARDSAVTVPILGRLPVGADPLRSVGVPVFGYVPWTLRADEFGRDGPQPLAETSFRRAIERMATVTANLAAL